MYVVALLVLLMVVFMVVVCVGMVGYVVCVNTVVFFRLLLLVCR